MPYLAVLVVLHLTVAALVYEVVRRTSGPWVALGVSVIVLFVGGGFENLFWAFQIGFVGATAAGLAAILVFDAEPLTPRRAAAGSGLLMAALATQGGPGIVCSVAVAIELLLDPRRRRMALLLAFPAAAYAVWYLAIGRTGVEAHEGVFRPAVTAMPPMIVTGFSTVAGTLVGVGTEVGGLVLAFLVVVALIQAVRQRGYQVAPRLVACLVAVALFYALIALARSFVGVSTATLTRYTYVSVVLVSIGLSAQIGRPRMTSPFTRRAWVLGGTAVLTLALVWNVRLLVAGRALFAERAERTRALVTVALDRPLPATTDPDRSLVLVPSPNALARIVDAYGSSLDDDLVPWAVASIRPEVLADAERVLREGAEIPLPPPRVP